MQIAQSKTREQFPLSYKKIIKKTIASIISYVILLLIIYVAVAFGSIGQRALSWLGIATVGIFGFLFLIFLLTYLYQRWYFAVYFYDLTNDFIQIKN